MESLLRLRQAQQELVARFLCSSVDQASVMVSQRGVEGHYSEILGYPEIVLRPLQVLDGDGFGGVAQLMDFDGLGEGPL
jgi:hypothetical protein